MCIPILFLLLSNNLTSNPFLSFPVISTISYYSLSFLITSYTPIKPCHKEKIATMSFLVISCHFKSHLVFSCHGVGITYYIAKSFFIFRQTLNIFRIYSLVLYHFYVTSAFIISMYFVQCWTIFHKTKICLLLIFMTCHMISMAFIFNHHDNLIFSLFNYNYLRAWYN